MIAEDTFPLEEIKARFFLYIANARLEESFGAYGAAIRFANKTSVLISPDELRVILAQLNWMDDLPDIRFVPAPFRGHKPGRQKISEIEFGKFIAADNYLQGFVATHDFSLLQSLSDIVFPKSRPLALPLPKWKLTEIFYWFAAFKKWAASRWPEFLHLVPQDDSQKSNRPKNPSAEILRKSVDSMIRALTKGDVSKESEILKIPCHRALTELNELARESREFREKYNKK